MIYLLAGEDLQAKDQKISEIKRKLFSSADNASFDFELLHAPQLDSDSLKKALMALPAISPKRLVVIRSLQKLNAHNKEIVLQFIQSKQETTDLILDTEENNVTEGFLGKIAVYAKVTAFGSQVQENVFDMTRVMSSKNSTQALMILSGLLNHGNHPLQILGGLVWFWGKQKSRLAADRFQKGLRAIQEADLNIKRSRLKPEYAVEVLVVKLCSLLALVCFMAINTAFIRF